MKKAFLLWVITLSLTACGQTGGLYLPDHDTTPTTTG